MRKRSLERLRQNNFFVSFAVILGVLLTEMQPLQAQETAKPEDLKTIEKRIDAEKSKADIARAKSGIMARDIANLQRESVAAARAVQRHEEQVSAIRARLTALERLRTRKVDDLRDRRKNFSVALAAMQRIAQFPPEALIAQPLKPADTVRTAILLRSAVSEINQQAVALRGELDFLVKARIEITERAKTLEETSALLDRERRRLGALMSRKKVLKRRADKEIRAAEQRAAQLAKKARTLRDLVRSLEREKKRSAKPTTTKTAGALATRPARQISKARGSLNLPVAGRIVGRYGEKTDGGLARKGVTMSTPLGAQVIATYDGSVAYAGQFRGYGLLLIIEHSEGYHSLLAGMARIDVGVGQEVIAGEPVGVMEDDGSGEPILYVELRRGGQPINPIPWLAERKGEVNG